MGAGGGIRTHNPREEAAALKAAVYSSSTTPAHLEVEGIEPSPEQDGKPAGHHAPPRELVVPSGS